MHDVHQQTQKHRSVCCVQCAPNTTTERTIWLALIDSTFLSLACVSLTLVVVVVVVIVVVVVGRQNLSAFVFRRICTALDWHVWTINAHNLFAVFWVLIRKLVSISECNRQYHRHTYTIVKGEWTRMQIITRMHARTCLCWCWCLQWHVWLIPNIVGPLINRSGVNKMHTKQLFTNLSFGNHERHSKPPNNYVAHLNRVYMRHQ